MSEQLQAQVVELQTSATAMPVGRPYIGEGNPINIGCLSHDTLRQQGPGGIRVTGCGKNAEIWTFLGPAGGQRIIF